ncbi:MAG: DHHA1 domain-containing protein [Halobacteriaceae archaeon]
MTGEFPVPALAHRARVSATALLEARRVLVAAHTDADGLTSAAVAAAALARAGVDHEVRFVDQLDADALAAVGESTAADPGADTVFLVDFGSGQLPEVLAAADRHAFTPVVADHHQPADAGERGPLATHCNPLLEGLDGATELSGAGATYLVARALAGAGPDSGDRPTSAWGEGPGREIPLAREGGGPTGVPPDPGNRDLAALAVVGAVGDRQVDDGLAGANRAVAAEGEAVGALATARDLALFGRQTRPLPDLLAYASDPRIPGISDDRAGAAAFLSGLDLDLRARRAGSDGVAGDAAAARPADAGETVDGSRAWRRWVDLDPDERRTVASALMRHAVSRGVAPGAVEGLVGTAYTLPAEPAGTELRDAMEFSTLLNATARYERAPVGLAVCLGDRTDGLATARDLLATHRRNLSTGIEYVRSEGVTREANVQWFHAGDEIRPTVVGIVAGMAVGTAGIDRGTPIVGFAEKADGAVKVSARGTGGLVRRGLDLAAAMGTAAAAVGGEGGGHDVAAGATIPAGAERAFVDRVDGVVGEQLD